MLNRASTYLYRRPGLILVLLLGPPLIYMLVVYLGSLSALLLNSFFYLEEFTGLVVREFTLRTYVQLFNSTNGGIFARTAGMALAVTIADAIIAFPLAYYIARYASPRSKTYLYIAVTLPLWSSVVAGGAAIPRLRFPFVLVYYATAVHNRALLLGHLLLSPSEISG